MATIQTLNKLKKNMELTMNNPLQIHGNISYSENMKCWIMDVDCDLDIYFDDVRYSSNNIHLYRNEVEVAVMCHTYDRITDY